MHIFFSAWDYASLVEKLWDILSFLCCISYLALACSRLSVSGGLKNRGGRRVGSGRERAEIPPSPFLSRIPLAADPALRPLAFSIVLTDREPWNRLILLLETSNNQNCLTKHFKDIVNWENHEKKGCYFTDYQAIQFMTHHFVINILIIHLF